MKVSEFRKMLDNIPDDAELKFEVSMGFLDDCVIEKYPEEYLDGYPPFYYLNPVCSEK